MNLSENHLCSPCFPCFLGPRNWSNKNGPFHPSPISLLVASHTWPAPSIAPRKKPSNWECWWSQWNRIVFLIFHTDIELEIMMQLMIIIIVLIYHIYIYIYDYICMIYVWKNPTSVSTGYWFLATLSPRLIVRSTQISRVNSTFTSSEKWLQLRDIRFSMAISMGKCCGQCEVRREMHGDTLTHLFQTTNIPLNRRQKKKTVYFRLSPRNSPYLGMVSTCFNNQHPTIFSCFFPLNPPKLNVENFCP